MINLALNKSILSYLNILGSSLNKKNDHLLKFQDNNITLQTNQKKIVQISSDEIILAGLINVENKIIVADKSPIEIESSSFKAFIKEIEESIVRLNHLGISYFCSNLVQETETIRNLINKTPFTLYEEESDNQNQKWLFVGNRLADWQQPLFEIVLTHNKDMHPSEWIPHFQIDLDTQLSINDLELITNKYFGKDFLKWKLNIDGIGIVLAMGIIDNINGTKIVLGLGTNKRNTKWHREHDLKKI